MIKLSQTGDDALKALCYIADRHPEVVQIKEIVASQGMSESCLRLIIADLNRSGIIQSKQGRNGGLMLGKPAAKITLYDVFLAVGEEM